MWNGGSGRRSSKEPDQGTREMAMVGNGAKLMTKAMTTTVGGEATAASLNRKGGQKKRKKTNPCF